MPPLVLLFFVGIRQVLESPSSNFYFATTVIATGFILSSTVGL
jgi:hypothetical protein